MPEEPLVDAPLGPEDASHRADIEESFIEVGQLIAGVRLRAESTPIRVVIGRKGSGKTHVLRHIENVSKRAGRDVSLCAIGRDLVSDPLMRAYSGASTITTFWIEIWRFAVLAAVLSRFTARNVQERAVRALQRRELTPADVREDFKDVVFESRYPFDPVSAVSYIRNRYRSEEALRERFRSLNFSDIEADAGTLLREYGEIHFLIDGLDEFAWLNPRVWLDLQIGLFKLVFMQGSSRSYIRNVHLTISMRNYAYGHALRDTHSDRVGPTQVAKLIWDRAAALEFLDQRLLQVAGQKFARANHLVGERPLASWLGFEEFKPFSRSKPEPVEYYLLRHTRCAPRQVIRVFNALCAEQNRLSARNMQLLPDRFGEVISNEARNTADNAVKTAAEELLAIFQHRLLLPAGAREREHAQEYFITEVSQALTHAIANCGTEITGRRVFQSNCLAALRPLFEEPKEEELVKKIEETLWRSGLIAYPLSGSGGLSWRYTWGEGEFGFVAPHEASETIGFHPTLIDLCRLKVHQDGPVF